MIKCIEASEVTLTTHLTHPFIIVWIESYLRFLSQKALAELKSFQYSKEHLHLVPKRRNIGMKNDENPMRKFHT